MSLIRKNNVFFPSLMNEFFKPDWFGGMENFSGSLPAVNIKTTEKDFEIALAVPGMNKEDFNIEIDDNVLTVSAEVKKDETTSESTYTRREFSHTSFKRAFTLPETVDEAKIEASYENGVLKFLLPKKEEALPKPKRLIEIG